MRQLVSLAEIDWIDTALRPRTLDAGVSVAECVPPIYPAYAKLFHPIYEDLTFQGDNLTWHEVEQFTAKVPADPKIPVERVMQDVMRRSTVVYGKAKANSRLVRIPWKDLAERCGLPFMPTLSSWSFTRVFPGGSWPRRLIGPEEGSIAADDLHRLTSLLRRHSPTVRCFFHVAMLGTTEWKGDLLFEGMLDDALLFPDTVKGVRLTPTHWFPSDRAWFVCTDYDLTFTLVGGSQGLVDDLLNSADLECVPVTPDTRIDVYADQARLAR